jgi:hypothetical protein
MKKLGLILCCLLFIGDHSPTSILVLAQDDLTTSYLTVQSRRDALANLTAERLRLVESGDQIALIRVSNQIAELHIRLFEFDAALSSVTGSLSVARQLAARDRALLADTLVLAGHTYIRRNQNTSPAQRSAAVES